MAMPAVAGALQSILGKGYSLHPHTFTHIKDDVGADQDWHKDGFLPRNGHGIRYHQPEHVLLFYYPQDTVAELGPTEILPCTQYVCFSSCSCSLFLNPLLAHNRRAPLGTG